MSKLFFRIDKKIDFQNHLIQIKWRDKTNFKYNEKDINYFESIEISKNIQEQWEKFEEYSKDFYSEENKSNRDDILSFYQSSWGEVENIYINKMEEIHKNKFPYKIIYGILSTSPRGWGFNLKGENPWFACPNDRSDRFLKIAMHEIMHVFFIEYFREEYKIKFNLNDNQLWDIQESLTVLLNIELSNILPEPDLGYPQHKKLREEVTQVWLETRNIDDVLDSLCKNLKK